jgi:hypothetical protein
MYVCVYFTDVSLVSVSLCYSVYIHTHRYTNDPTIINSWIFYIHAYISIHTYIHTGTLMTVSWTFYINTYVHTYAFMHTYIRIDTYIHTGTLMTVSFTFYINTYVHTYAFMHTYICIDTYIHTGTQMTLPFPSVGYFC